jgi:hypothetical protein
LCFFVFGVFCVNQCVPSLLNGGYQYQSSTLTIQDAAAAVQQKESTDEEVVSTDGSQFTTKKTMRTVSTSQSGISGNSQRKAMHVVCHGPLLVLSDLQLRF